ncbi:MAG: T9SS type A sorting domain-containing protein [Bacteroidota bacterium]
MNEQTSNLDALLARAREGAPLMTLPEVESLLADAPMSPTPSKGTTIQFVMMISTLISIITLSLFVNLSPQPVEAIKAFPPLHLNEAQLAQIGISIEDAKIYYAAKVPYIGATELTINHLMQLSSSTWRKTYVLERATNWPETDFHLQTITKADGEIMFARNDRKPAYLFAAYVPVKVAMDFAKDDSLVFWFSPREALWDVLPSEEAALYREYAEQLLGGQGVDPFVHQPFQSVDALRLDEQTLNRLGFDFRDSSMHYGSIVPSGQRLSFDFGVKMQCITQQENPDWDGVFSQPYPQFVSDTNGFQSFRWNMGNETKEKLSPAYLGKVRKQLVAVWVERDFLDEPYLFWFEADDLFLEAVYASAEAPSGERYATWLKTQQPGLQAAKNSIQLSPNPAQSYVKLSLPETNESYRWQLLNLQGQVLQTSDWIGAFEDTDIPLQGFSSGVYLVVVRLKNKKQFSTQLLIEN